MHIGQHIRYAFMARMCRRRYQNSSLPCVKVLCHGAVFYCIHTLQSAVRSRADTRPSVCASLCWSMLQVARRERALAVLCTAKSLPLNVS